jgi:hypothetical protein
VKLHIQLSQWLIPAALRLMPLVGFIVVGFGKIGVRQQCAAAGDRRKNPIDYLKIHLSLRQMMYQDFFQGRPSEVRIFVPKEVHPKVAGRSSIMRGANRVLVAISTAPHWQL